jgi:hypothetical protein
LAKSQQRLDGIQGRFIPQPLLHLICVFSEPMDGRSGTRQATSGHRLPAASGSLSWRLCFLTACD